MATILLLSLTFRSYRVLSVQYSQCLKLLDAEASSAANEISETPSPLRLDSHSAIKEIKQVFCSKIIIMLEIPIIVIRRNLNKYLKSKNYPEGV